MPSSGLPVLRASPVRLVTSVFGHLLTGALALACHKGVAAKPAAAPTATASTDVPRNALAEALVGLLEPAGLKEAQHAVYAVRAETGDMVLAHNERALLNVASNAKLFTTYAVLHGLPLDHRFETTVATDVPLRGGTSVRTLYVVGSGAPDFQASDLAHLAQEVAAMGVTRVERLVIDTTRYGSDGFPPAYLQKDEFAYYRTHASALPLDFNAFTVHFEPTAIGKPAAVAVFARFLPLQVRNNTATVAGRHNRLTLTVDNSTIVAGGSIGQGAAVQWYRYPLLHPATAAGAVFRAQLAQNGVRVPKRVQHAAAPSTATPLASVPSASLASLVQTMNKTSNNMLAEQLFVALAPEATYARIEDAFAAARARAMQVLAASGISLTGLRLDNGSGLYDSNRASATQIVALLRALTARVASHRGH